jgi:Ino eighty subunit 2
VLRLGAPKGKEDWVQVGTPLSADVKPKVSQPGTCGVDGCGERRKYRCVRKFDTGGCSMAHLKLVEQSLA